MRRFVAVLLVLCVAVPANTDEVQPLSLRELTYRADTVLLAVPVERAAPGRFKVTKVLRGNGVQVDATIALSEADQKYYSLSRFAAADPDALPIGPIEALLFLSAPVEQGKPVQLAPSGLFLGMPEGNVLGLRQLNKPGSVPSPAQEGRVWQNFVADAKTAAATIDEVLRLKAADRDRTAGLLRWIERHRLEFGGGFRDDDRGGWGSLETDVFDWICEKGQPDECWAAAKLYAELNHGAALSLKGPYFSTPSGRDFLFQIALNTRMLDGDRARALALLTHPRTLAPCSDADLVPLIQKIQLLLGEKSEVLPGGAAAALRAIQSQRGTSTLVQMELTNALPALESLYKTEKPGAGRDLLIELILTIGGAEHWKTVSGDKTGLAVLLRDFGNSNDKIYFWLQVLPATEKIYACPTLVLEQLGPQDKVLKTKSIPLPTANGPRWENGWTPGELLLVQIPRDGMLGNWRVSVNGSVGKDKTKLWKSEPKLFAGPKPLNPDGRSPWGGYGDKDVMKKE